MRDNKFGTSNLNIDKKGVKRPLAIDYSHVRICCPKFIVVNCIKNYVLIKLKRQNVCFCLISLFYKVPVHFNIFFYFLIIVK